MLEHYGVGSLLLFGGVVALMLWIDLFLHKKDKPISFGHAALWTLIWVSCSLAFAGYIHLQHGSEAALTFVAAWAVEKSLAVDNLFVIMSVFALFKIAQQYQHRVLYYGILGALILRGLFITFGVSILFLGPWVIGFLGLFVIFSAYEMAKHDEDDDPLQHWSVRWIKRAKFLPPVDMKGEGHNFFIRKDGVLFMTGLFLALVYIEFLDIAFAFDSVPAVLGITQDLFLVYTSNIFAILGLRSMYFMLQAAKNTLHHLEKAVICILVFVGCKMILEALHAPVLNYLGIELWEIGIEASLAVIGGLLSLGVIASLVFPEPAAAEENTAENSQS